MRYRLLFYGLVASLLWNGFALAKVDLVILPKRDTAQLTIYNSADLTLVREQRALSLKTGQNRLQFSWANTLIDPTSLDMLPKMHGDKIDIIDLVFPPRMKNLGLWNVKSRVSGSVPVEINYLTSGLSWRAFYMGVLGTDERTMNLKGYVRVTNNSGEDYDNAQVRLIVGKINLIDRITELARRNYPYGRPEVPLDRYPAEERDKVAGMKEVKRRFALAEKAMLARPKEIKKEGLSEYFLYTIEGTETIPNGWSKRLPSFDVKDIPVINLYKYEEERFGKQVVRFLSFKNDKMHKMGKTPIPGGILKVFRHVDEEGHISYEGSSRFKYIPVDEDVELNLGQVSSVIVKPKLMDFKSDKYLFNSRGEITGWEEIREFEIEVKNTRTVPVKMEIIRNLKTVYWDIQNTGDFGQYEKVDSDTVKFTVNLDARDSKKINYRLITQHGQRTH